MHEREQLRHELLAVTEFLQRIGSSRDLLTVLSPEEKIDLTLEPLAAPAAAPAKP